jgi:Protein of unknown function (DUF3060)
MNRYPITMLAAACLAGLAATACSSSDSSGTAELQASPAAKTTSGPVKGAPDKITGSDIKAVYTCNNHKVKITGNNDYLTLTGSCPNVHVAGSNNYVIIQKVGTLTVSGNNNRVKWIKGLHGNPKTSISGNSNTILGSSILGGN